jgi:hypothetical protein
MLCQWHRGNRIFGWLWQCFVFQQAVQGRVRLHTEGVPGLGNPTEIAFGTGYDGIVVMEGGLLLGA